jgi:hypothetical protein
MATRPRLKDRGVSSRRPENSIPFVRTVVGAAIGAKGDDLAYVVEQERFAAGQENLLHAELHRFACDPLHAREAERPALSPWRGSYAAIAAPNVAIEVRV